MGRIDNRKIAPLSRARLHGCRLSDTRPAGHLEFRAYGSVLIVSAPGTDSDQTCSIFEALARAWVDWAGQSGRLPFEAEQVGNFWSRVTQVNVVAVNWPKKQILLGECKWGAGQVEADVLRQLIDKKSALVLQALPHKGTKWTVSYAMFGRSGFKANTKLLVEREHCSLVGLAQLDHDIGR